MNTEKMNVGGILYDICDAKAREMISDEYDQGKSYAAGDLCIHDNKLHAAIEPTTGAWDGTKWEEKTIAEVIAEQNSKITIITSTVKYNEWTYLNFPTGFNKQNCVIISLFLIVDGSLFSSDMSTYLTQYVNSELQFEAFIHGTEGNIGVKTNTERNEGKTIAIVLLKIK